MHASGKGLQKYTELYDRFFSQRAILAYKFLIEKL